MTRPVLWLVTDQLPAPPRNGITLPLFHHLAHLQQHFSVRLCLLEPDGGPPQQEFLARNEALYGPVLRLRLQRRPRWRRVVDELARREMFQHGWVLAAGQDGAAQVLQGAPAVLVSPMSALAQWRAVCAAARLSVGRTVAAVNDCTAAEYRHRGRAAGLRPRQRVKAAIDALRAGGIGRIEADLLARCDVVLVQTDADRTALRTLAGPAAAARAQVVPNGVDARLFALPPPGSMVSPGVLFVADLGGEYVPTAHWLVERVWPLVRQAVPAARLHVVGRNAPAPLLQALATADGVVHQPYADDLLPCYAGAAVVWSPVFKGFGLINKTLEAMAAARAVVGGTAAFNGIQGFAAGTHACVVHQDDAAAMAAATVVLLRDPAAAQATGLAARSLVVTSFDWERAAQAVRAAILGTPADP